MTVENTMVKRAAEVAKNEQSALPVSLTRLGAKFTEDGHAVQISSREYVSQTRQPTIFRYSSKSTWVTDHQAPGARKALEECQ